MIINFLAHWQIYPNIKFSESRNGASAGFLAFLLFLKVQEMGNCAISSDLKECALRLWFVGEIQKSLRELKVTF
jgi:hypothetical protein